jgi:hypothetical protein
MVFAGDAKAERDNRGVQQHVIETIQGVTANQQRGSMVAAYGADQAVRGVQTFRDPSTGRTVELSNLYDHAWANGNDKYSVSTVISSHRSC